MSDRKFAMLSGKDGDAKQTAAVKPAKPVPAGLAQAASGIPLGLKKKSHLSKFTAKSGYVCTPANNHCVCLSVCMYACLSLCEMVEFNL